MVFIFFSRCGEILFSRAFKACAEIFVLLFCIFMSNSAMAKDFGKMGTTFEIKEEGFLAMIHRKLKNIDIEKEQAKMTEHARQRIEEPEAVFGITKAKQHRYFTFDPTYVLDEDIKLPDGKLLYAAGTKVNPLEKMDFDRKLYFIDARDKTQIKWLKHELQRISPQLTEKNKENKEKEKTTNTNTDINSENGTLRQEHRIILVGGRPIELSNKLQTNIYFDQFGELTKKFGILHVPATVEQMPGEKVLQIKEVYIDG